MISNLSLLGFFKYFNFLTFNYTALMESLGLTGMGYDNVFKVTLPLGISFYTFQSMSYAIDVYRGDAQAIRNPIDYWCYVAMFPQLVAGPIIRFQDVADQLRERTHTLEKFARGIAFLAWGSARRSCSPIHAAKWPTWRSTLARSVALTRGSVPSRTPFRSISISAPTATWPSDSD